MILCFLCVLIFTLPAIFDRFKLSNEHTSNIGSTIGGITAPFLGIVSSILLFITIRLQIETNEKSRIKNEADIIFLLLNQLDSEYDKFYFAYEKGPTGGIKTAYKFSGLEGVHKFIHDFCHEWKSISVQISDIYEVRQIELLTHSYSLVFNKLKESYLDETLKLHFHLKLKAIYEFKFHNEIKQLLYKCVELNKSDNTVEALKRFHEFYTNEYFY